MNEKLQRELKAVIIEPIERIAGYLDGAMLTDEKLAKAIEDEKKTLRECYDYIKKKAKEAAGSNNSIMIEDGQVFDWAKEYYLGQTEEKKSAAKPTEKAEEEKPAEEKKKPAKKKATKKEEPKEEESTEVQNEEQVGMELTEEDEEDIFG